MKEETKETLQILGVVFAVILMIIILVPLSLYIITKEEVVENPWQIEVATEFINVREDAGTNFRKIAQVRESETYNVIEIFLEDESYNWYRIWLEDGENGWVATPKNGEWIKDINNPNGDIYPPLISSNTTILNFKNENDINYNHLTIIDSSDYTIFHKIYSEDDINYWIDFIVEDIAGNKSAIVQKGIFEEIPTNVIKWEAK